MQASYDAGMSQERRFTSMPQSAAEWLQPRPDPIIARALAFAADFKDFIDGTDTQIAALREVLGDIDPSFGHYPMLARVDAILGQLQQRNAEERPQIAELLRTMEKSSGPVSLSRLPAPALMRSFHTTIPNVVALFDRTARLLQISVNEIRQYDEQCPLRDRHACWAFLNAAVPAIEGLKCEINAIRASALLVSGQPSR